jgi:hypothetical protein
MIDFSDELIDKNLRLICKSEETPFQITHFVDRDGRNFGLLSNAERFASKMEEHDLISVNGDFAFIEDFGFEVYKKGGWVKYLEDLTTRSNQEAENKKNKEAIEIEKTEIDLQLAKKMLQEYPKTKWIARIGFIMALVLFILELIRSFVT